MNKTMLRLVQHQNSCSKCHLYNCIWQDLQQSTTPGTRTMVKDSSVAQLCPTLCNLMDCSMPGFPAHHQLLELAQTHVHRLSDAIQPSHPLLSPSPPEKQKCLRYSYQPQGDHVLIQIWTKKQLCNKKLSQPVGVYIVRYITLKC